MDLGFLQNIFCKTFFCIILNPFCRSVVCAAHAAVCHTAVGDAPGSACSCGRAVLTPLPPGPALYK